VKQTIRAASRKVDRSEHRMSVHGIPYSDQGITRYDYRAPYRVVRSGVYRAPSSKRR